MRKALPKAKIFRISKHQSPMINDQSGSIEIFNKFHV